MYWIQRCSPALTDSRVEIITEEASPTSGHIYRARKNTHKVINTDGSGSSAI